MSEQLTGQINMWDFLTAQRHEPYEAKVVKIERNEPIPDFMPLPIENTEQNVKIKPCDCGNTRIAVAITGCGSPHSYEEYPLHYDQYLYELFCPKCYKVATEHNGWCSNKLKIENAIRDWNENPRKDSYEWRIKHLNDSKDFFLKFMDRFDSLKDFEEMWKDG